MDIRLVKNEDIDKVKWNSCVHYANNGNVFGYKWYLDFVAKEWDGLVEGDYESVFPLVWRDGFFNKRELFQPGLMREMGIYSINVLSPARIKAFLEAIPPEYKHVDIVLNEQNQPPPDVDFTVTERTNHQLLLAEDFDTIEARFSDRLRATIEAAEDHHLIPTSSVKPEKLADFYRQHARDRRELDRNFHALQRIMYNVLHRGWGFASGLYNQQEELLAANFYVYSHNKVMSLAPLTSPEGEQVGALSYLFYTLIRSHAGRPMILDFNTDGEDELALAFGASPTNYYQIKRDKRVLGIF